MKRYLRRFCEKSYPLGLFSAAMLATVIFSVASWLLLTRIIHVPNGADTADALGIIPSIGLQLIKPEPVENYVFILTLAAGVFFCSLAGKAWAIGSQRASHLKAATIASTLGIVGALAWLFATDWSSILPPTLSFPVAAAQSDIQQFLVLCVTAAVGVVLLTTVSDDVRLKYLPLLVCSVPLAAFSSMVLISNDDAYLGSTHYEVFVYPLIQDWLGQGIHLGQKSQYGMYAIFLRPLWAVTGGPATIAISSVMATLLFFSHLALVVFMVRFSKHTTLAAAFAVLGITVALLLYPFWPGDAYFEFFPIRLVFPGLAMGLLCWRPTRERYRFPCYVALAFGLAWNFESGVVGLAIYIVFTVALEFSPNKAMLTQLALRQAAMAISAIVIVVASIVAYYLVRFEAMPDLSGALTMVRAFSAGVGAEPMPLFGAWGIHCLIYGASIFVGIRSLWQTSVREDRQQAAALLAMATAGLLWLRYYQGRSMPLPLTFVSAPAICCAGLLADRGIAAIQGWQRRLIAAMVSIILAAPVAAALTLWVRSDPAPQRKIAELFRERADARMNLVVGHVLEMFNAAKQSEKDELLVIAPYAHLVQLRSGRPSPILAAGMCQIWFKSELAAVVSSLSNPNTRMAVFGGTEACPLSMISLDPLISDVLERDFLEAAPWGGCSLVSSAEVRTFVRRTTQIPAIATGEQLSLVNLALGKTATESSSVPDSRASAAVDGRTDGRYAERSTTHTHLQANPWWQVDLGATNSIGSIEVWNRTDCCSARLRDYWVFVSEKPFSLGDTPSKLLTRGDVFSSHQESVPCPKITVPVNTIGRYVRIQIKGEGYLSLAEVRVLRK